LGSKVQHRGKAAQTKPENITEGKEAAHSPHSKWRRKLYDRGIRFVGIAFI
jgi:hypothetical protein